MSLRQIAQNLGLSITTVSRALAGYSDVSAATRQRVQAEAERIHYVPNEVARRLQRGRADALPAPGTLRPPVLSANPTPCSAAPKAAKPR